MGCTLDALGKVYDREGHHGTFEGALDQLGRWLTIAGDPVDTGHWQALKDVPQTKTQELRSVVLMYGIPEGAKELADEVKPSDPWAERQFQERVGGEPLNPGETYKEWPWYKGNVETHKEQGQFSHTYMERYWPLWGGELGMPPKTTGEAINRELKGVQGPRRGIRYRYGDLADVFQLLAREPHTRQAYLPVWFPEDTGATDNQRVPCSLGYHFMLRDGKLHCLYTIRSCDFLRHFRDDVYMTARLVQWVLDQLRKKDLVEFEHGETPDMLMWDQVTPGELTMVMHSLHVFEGDMTKMKKEYGNGRAH